MVGNDTENQAKASNHKTLSKYKVLRKREREGSACASALDLVFHHSLIHSQFHLLGSTT